MTKGEQHSNSDMNKPLHKRKTPGLPGDIIIINELGREEWASEWCRRVYNENFPRGVLRRRRM